jgi:peptidoglycan hydrolase CwlO-like protein
MYISLFSLCFGVLFILGAIALVILIMVLIKLFGVLSRVNSLMQKNEKNIEEILVTLPKATENFLKLSDDLKSVGEVLTETTATAIETKENIEDYTDIFMDLLKIVKTVFVKKK